MAIKKIILCIFLLGSALCQAQNKYKQLSIGDTVPNIVFSLLNRESAKSNLYDYRGKFLIIDCWSIYCAPCIKALPEFAVLQAKFKDRLRILTLEGGSPQNKVLEFLDKRAADGEKIGLPVAHINDRKNNTFYDLFPVLNYGFPVEIWLDQKGVLIGITPGTFVNEPMINRVLSGDFSKLVVKRYQKDFKRDRPLLVNNNGGPDSIFNYRSMITGFNDSIPNSGNSIVQRTNKYTRLFFANLTISELIKAAIHKGKSSDTYDKQLVFQVKDSSNYVRPERGSDSYDQIRERGFCYELILPPDRTIDDAFAFMVSDLQRFFKVKVMLIMKPVKCLVLEKINDDVLRSKGGQADYKSEDSNSYEQINLKNNSFKLLVSLLNRKGYPVIIDHTGIDYSVDFNLKMLKEYDFKNLNKSLHALGLKATEEMVDMEVISIID